MYERVHGFSDTPIDLYVNCTELNELHTSHFAVIVSTR